MSKAASKGHKKAKTAVLIINTFSGRGERLFFKALDALGRHNIQLVATYPVRQPERLLEVIDSALTLKADVVIVGGGDGTISTIVDKLAKSSAVLGLLPLGTGNSFIRSLGLPLDIDAAVEVICNGKIQSVDLGIVNGDYFTNVVSIGFPADVARRTSRHLKRRLGPLAYGLAGLRQFISAQKFECDLVSSSGKIEKVITHQLIVANGTVYGITPLGLDTDVDNRQLLVLTMDMANRWQLLWFWLHFLTGRHHRLSSLHYFLTDKLTLKTEPLKEIDVDGDTVTKTPAEFSIAPEALRVVVAPDHHTHNPKL